MYKTWIEVNKANVTHNARQIRKNTNSKAQIWAVIKSNAYGHGLWTFAKLADTIKLNNKDIITGFCVDSVIEGEKLRAHGIQKPILVLGPTINSLFKTAKKNNITISVANKETLTALEKEIPNPKNRPEIHVKIDTGMNRQGFYIEELDKIAKQIKRNKHNLTGVFSHLASAKDITYPSSAKNQFTKFTLAVKILKKNGFNNLLKHISATAGSMINPEYHLDTIRTGIGLYGIYPSSELEAQMSSKYKLKPILSWHAVVSEVKTVEKNEFIGYDFTEKVNAKTRLAIIPIGYWHGLPWSLSGRGQVLINGQLCI